MRGREIASVAAIMPAMLAGCGFSDTNHEASLPSLRPTATAIDTSAQPSAPAVESLPVDAQQEEDSLVEATPTLLSMSHVREHSQIELDGMEGKVMRAECSGVSLRRVEVPYIDMNGVQREGSIDVASTIAEDVAEIFDALYEMQFPIHSVTPLEELTREKIPFDRAQLLDDISMAANNTSSFNCRASVGPDGKPTGRLSDHAHAKAIDINPVQNPFVVHAADVMPPAGKDFISPEATSSPGVIRRESEIGAQVIKLFADRGWQWGGDFTNTKDFQHFYYRK